MMSSFAQIRQRNPKARFRRVRRGSLPRNHVGFFTSSDGYAFVVNGASPSKRFGIAARLTFIDYERPGA